MAEAAAAMWNVTMIHLHADVRVVEISQSIVSDHRKEQASLQISRMAQAVPRRPRMSGAMHHAKGNSDPG